MVPAVFPLGQLGVVAELLRRGRARRLHLFRHGGKELHVIPPRVVEHVRKRSFARARGADGRAVRALVLVLVDGRSVRARVVGFVLLRRRRARFHGEVGVKLPQEVQPRAKFADGGSLDVLLEREGHLTQTLALLRGESRRVHARQQRRGGVHGRVGVGEFLVGVESPSRRRLFRRAEKPMQREPRAVRPRGVSFRGAR